ncbi:MAG: sulfur carrier protein ThiS [Gemmatimonadota bacterium]|nr:sulfur carrier protein ThiS [Gemmatimonadota bacterium]
MPNPTTAARADGSPAEGEVVEVHLNGRTRAVPARLSVRALLEHLALEPEMIVVERNHEILDRASYDQVPVVAGDRIELVHFVGGG